MPKLSTLLWVAWVLGLVVVVWLLNRYSSRTQVAVASDQETAGSQLRTLAAQATSGPQVRPPGDQPIHGAKLIDGTYVLLRDVDGTFTISHWIPELVDQQIVTNKSTVLTGSQKAIYARIPILIQMDSDTNASVMAFGGKVVPETKSIVITFDNGSSSGQLTLQDQYFIYVTDGIEPQGTEKSMGPRIAQLQGFDDHGRELFAHAERDMR